jgi:hypothetical protein
MLAQIHNQKGTLNPFLNPKPFQISLKNMFHWHCFCLPTLPTLHVKDCNKHSAVHAIVQWITFVSPLNFTFLPLSIPHSFFLNDDGRIMEDGRMNCLRKLHCRFGRLQVWLKVLSLRLNICKVIMMATFFKIWSKTSRRQKNVSWFCSCHTAACVYSNHITGSESCSITLWNQWYVRHSQNPPTLPKFAADSKHFNISIY